MTKLQAIQLAGIRKRGAPVSIKARLRVLNEQYDRMLNSSTNDTERALVKTILDHERAQIEDALKQARAHGISMEHASRLSSHELTALVRSVPRTTHRVRATSETRFRERRDGSRRNRNQTRGGPSDDPDPSEPPSHGRYCRWVGCGDWFIPKRDDAKFCSPACKSKAYRHSKQDPSSGKPLPRLPVTAVTHTAFIRSAVCQCPHPLLLETADCFWCGRPSDRASWAQIANQEMRARHVDVGPRPLTILEVMA